MNKKHSKIKNNFTFGIFLLIFGFLNAQVGINTSTPNGATVLDINSNAKGMLIPRLMTTERNTSLADNDPLTSFPAPGNNAALTAGTLIFNTTENRFEFWDGVVWRQLFVATSSVAGNDGVVKINSGAGGVKPTYTLAASGNGYGPRQLILYTTPLVFAPSPTTSWPETTVPFPGITTNIYQGSTAVNQRWIENIVPGQVHIWRLIATVTAGAASSGSLRATFLNADSGFSVSSVSLLPSGSSEIGGKNLTFYFYTIGDPDSLAPGRGYQMFLETDQSVSVIIDSFTRISLFKD